MNKKTLTALQGSIKKWWDIRFDGLPDLGDDNCALCQLFPSYSCDGCPVVDKAKERGCLNTPFIAWSNHHKEGHKNYGERRLLPDCAICKSLATQEINFLKGLLP